MSECKHDYEKSDNENVDLKAGSTLRTVMKCKHCGERKNVMIA